MRPYRKFIDTETTRFLDIVPYQKYVPQADFSLKTSELVRAGKAQPQKLLENLPATKYKPYDDYENNTTKMILPPFLPFNKEQKQQQLTVQKGSPDSFALIPSPLTYKERTTNSTTYPTDVKKHYINIDTKYREHPSVTKSTNFRWSLFRPIKNCIS